MIQQTRTVHLSVEFPNLPTDWNTLREWLADKAQKHSLTWLLAHADDGVLWGLFVNGTLRLSNEAFPAVSPALRAATLQQARLFGERGELLVWRDASGWHARLVMEDSSGKPTETFDESYLLWGSAVEETRDDFSLVRHGSEGLRHAPPLTLLIGSSESSLALKVRHMIDYDQDGQAHISMSRLVGVQERGAK